MTTAKATTDVPLYRVVESEDYWHFTGAVASLLADGWECVGGVHVWGLKYMQAVVKKAKGRPVGTLIHAEELAPPPMYVTAVAPNVCGVAFGPTLTEPMRPFGFAPAQVTAPPVARTKCEPVPPADKWADLANAVSALSVRVAKLEVGVVNDGKAIAAHSTSLSAVNERLNKVETHQRAVKAVLTNLNGG